MPKRYSAFLYFWYKVFEMISKFFILLFVLSLAACASSQGASEAKQETKKEEAPKRQSPTKTNRGKAAPTNL